MANLRTAIDSAFWDQTISTPKTLDACARSIPGEPFPMDAARGSRVLRIQQLSLLRNGFPWGIIPSYSATSHSDFTSFSLQSLFLQLRTSHWWLGLVGQFRPKNLISSRKAESSDANKGGKGKGRRIFSRAVRHILDKSCYAFGLSTQFSPTPSTSLLLSTERLGDKKTPRHKFMVFHQLPYHDVTLEAAWPELFLDHKGRYWDVPKSISLDMLSHASESGGFRYRLGLHKNSGRPRVVDGLDADSPGSLMPGLHGKAAFSYEKILYLWRKKEKLRDAKKEVGRNWRPNLPYDLRLRNPHAAISGILGGTFAAWFGDRGNTASAESLAYWEVLKSDGKIGTLNADLFGSVCCSLQFGRFKRLVAGLTRIDARLDICSATALAERHSASGSTVTNEDKPSAFPKLNLILQQQVIGPIMFRVDSRFWLDSLSEKKDLHMEDMIYSLSYSLRLLQSGKVVAWYSPKRKEGMIELRLFEF